MAVVHETTVSKRGSGYGFRCTCGEAPNQSSKQRAVAEQRAAMHVANATAAMTEVSFTHSNARVQNMIDVQLTKLARMTRNIEQACEDGRISEHDRDERIARAEQGIVNTIAHFSGQPRPKQRESQPLDDPDAGRVG